MPKHVPEYGPLSLLAGAMYRSSCLHEGSVQSKGEDLEDAGTGPAPLSHKPETPSGPNPPFLHFLLPLLNIISLKLAVDTLGTVLALVSGALS